MPVKARKACIKQGCTNLTDKGQFCAEHTTTKPFQFKNPARYEQNRASASERGYNWKWRNYRKNYLRRHPLCNECGQPAKVVDHIEDHKGNKGKFWDKNNHQALCISCHNKKTWATILSKKYTVTIDKRKDKIQITTTPIRLEVH
jgi:5-methylcytosine-specific restriction protein A